MLTKGRVDAFFPGKRPRDLRGGNARTARDSHSLEAFQERLERPNRSQFAREFQERLNKAEPESTRQSCRDTNMNWSVVSRHPRLSRLPDDIIDLLDKNQTPEVLRRFTVKRLDALTRLPAAEATSSFMREVHELTPCEISTLA